MKVFSTASEVDWMLLRRPLIIAAVSILLAYTVGYASRQYLQAAKHRYQSASARLEDLLQLHRSVTESQELYSFYVDRFHSLQEKGVIGKEPRLTWVEALEETNKKLRLPLLRYAIEPRRSIDLVGYAYDKDKLELYHSLMALTMGVLHEGDLLVVLKELRRYASGRFDVRRCELERLVEVQMIRVTPDRANLQVHCRLYWYTVEVRSEYLLSG